MCIYVSLYRKHLYSFCSVISHRLYTYQFLLSFREPPTIVHLTQWRHYSRMNRCINHSRVGRHEFEFSLRQTCCHKGSKPQSPHLSKGNMVESKKIHAALFIYCLAHR